MLRRRVGIFVIGFCCRIIIHVVAEQVTERNRVGVIMINAGVLLMRVAGVERHAFIHISVAIPIAGNILFVGVVGDVPGVGVPTVEHGHAIHENPNLAAAG